ncbi:NAD(P)H-dependent oxidoreductase [Elizabethkingia meningoseptica]|uniref:NAD(P)H-dependent oxidoreductase n=2 Tax=Elizabethkingia meningoseptica TaxID=238 RepID=A0A1V3U4G2_ELIME|nr:NAD(P)H-dependent oxidoreductase [Elizabethkingia meningoseptica]AQX11510.1 NAD(P)H-dependent oxidoreductase [Elizabethkingia meningoseptica]EJK5329145.1 NAD(P)H-dependent oxidoreductase [Elizabethkingia meningoseptica]MDE5435462.1 NAD(P)H-dependent oxidoreductase [Elizabethkingia meningoseptica]MDE5449111.1 NAD(P)H-dependent oxidoreductase [Elizabethkingia meningoseptica]MDE5468967.1 NAD(P)H-dependent oxidoreductase [Elizabethkingia meningoseptica]
MKLLDALHWRYATKKFDSSKKVSEENLQKILKAAYLAPSSSGLQPYKVIVIKDQTLKEKLVPIFSNQQQIADSTYVLVFAAWDNYTEQNMETIFHRTVSERGLPENAMDDYKNMLKGAYLKREAEANFAHTARQAYISFGLALAAAAELEIDATPMEGFNNEQLDEALGLKELNLKSVVAMPLGYRDSSGDWLVNLKKVRQPEEEFFIYK